MPRVLNFFLYLLCFFSLVVESCHGQDIKKPNDRSDYKEAEQKKVDNKLFENLEKYIQKTPECQKKRDFCRKIGIKDLDQEKIIGDNNILIIGAGMFLLPLLYSERILGHYKYKNDENIAIKYYPDIKISQHMFDSYNLIKNYKKSKYIIYKKLDKILIFYKKTFKVKENYQKYIGHDDPIFSYLLANNPNSNFVILHTGEDSLLFEDICEVKNSDIYFQALEEGINDYADSIKNIVVNYNIKYINISMGLNYSDFYDLYRQNNCHGVPPERSTIYRYIKTKLKLWDLLKSLDVIIIQSGPYPSSPIKSSEDPAYLYDCKKFDHTLRVGYAENQGLSIAKEGLDPFTIKIFPPYSKQCKKMCRYLYT